MISFDLLINVPKFVTNNIKWLGELIGLQHANEYLGSQS